MPGRLGRSGVTGSDAPYCRFSLFRNPQPRQQRQEILSQNEATREIPGLARGPGDPPTPPMLATRLLPPVSWALPAPALRLPRHGRHLGARPPRGPCRGDWARLPLQARGVQTAPRERPRHRPEVGGRLGARPDCSPRGRPRSGDRRPQPRPRPTTREAPSAGSSLRSPVPSSGPSALLQKKATTLAARRNMAGRSLVRTASSCPRPLHVATSLPPPSANGVITPAPAPSPRLFAELGQWGCRTGACAGVPLTLANGVAVHWDCDCACAHVPSLLANRVFGSSVCGPLATVSVPRRGAVWE